MDFIYGVVFFFVCSFVSVGMIFVNIFFEKFIVVIICVNFVMFVRRVIFVDFIRNI